jgi:hypothetical protein
MGTGVRPLLASVALCLLAGIGALSPRTAAAATLRMCSISCGVQPGCIFCGGSCTDNGDGSVTVTCNYQCTKQLRCS